MGDITTATPATFAAPAAVSNGECASQQQPQHSNNVGVATAHEVLHFVVGQKFQM